MLSPYTKPNPRVRHPFTTMGGECWKVLGSSGQGQERRHVEKNPGLLQLALADLQASSCPCLHLQDAEGLVRSPGLQRRCGVPTGGSMRLLRAVSRQRMRKRRAAPWPLPLLKMMLS